jgi:hypothetical protein
MPELDTQTKLAIYRHFAETWQRPSLEVAETVGSDVSSVRAEPDLFAGLRLGGDFWNPRPDTFG